MTLSEVHDHINVTCTHKPQTHIYLWPYKNLYIIHQYMGIYYMYNVIYVKWYLFWSIAALVSLANSVTASFSLSALLSAIQANRHKGIQVPVTMKYMYLPELPQTYPLQLVELHKVNTLDPYKIKQINYMYVYMNVYMLRVK